MTTLYDKDGRPCGGLVDKAQDPDKQAALKAEDARLMNIMIGIMNKIKAEQEDRDQLRG